MHNIRDWVNSFKLAAEKIQTNPGKQRSKSKLIHRALLLQWPNSISSSIRKPPYECKSLEDLSEKAEDIESFIETDVASLKLWHHGHPSESKCVCVWVCVWWGGGAMIMRERKNPRAHSRQDTDIQKVSLKNLQFLSSVKCFEMFFW